MESREKIRFDMHTHSKNSHDSQCEISDMAEAAQMRGLAGFAVTDHCDIEYYETQDLHGTAKNSIADAEKANKEFGIKILKGIEVGEATWNKELADNIVQSYDFDVVIGSVHAAKYAGYEMPYSLIDFGEMGKESAKKYLDRYLDDMYEMTECFDFDILAHLTCPLRYMNGKYELNIDSRPYESKIKKILERIIEKGIALEINTSNICEGGKYCEFMPEEWIMKMYAELGGYLITVGSDAHIAQNSANAFDKAYEMLKRNGFKKAYFYEKRTAKEYEI